VSLNGTVWAPIGPSPMSENGGQDNGLVTSIAVNPNNTNIIYLGTAQGGVWRSSDGGDSWVPLFDRQLSLGIGEPAGIALDPNNTNTIYVGTSGRVGSAEPDTVQQPSAGLFKSLDGGASWIALGWGFPAGNSGNATQFINRAINVIIVEPTNSNILYLSAYGGVYTSNNGGLDWTKASGLGAGNPDARSLVLDLSSPPNKRIIYTGVSGSGIFRSVDGGQSFTQILSPTTPSVAAALGTGGGFGRAVVALAPPTSPPNAKGIQVLYVTLSGGGKLSGGGTVPDPVGLFISIDQGNTWTQQAATGASPGATYGGYALNLAVDPASPGDGSNDTLYWGYVRQYKSTNSGANFAATGSGVLHADTHTWTMVPKSGGATTVYCGCDGGIFVSTNGGSTWKPLNKNGLQTGLFYNLAIKPDATASVTVGALQDNQLQTTRAATPPAWNATFGGDGWDVAYDGSSPPVLYGSSGGPNSVVSQSTDDGQTFSSPASLQPPWNPNIETGGFLLNQIAADPSASGILYMSGAQNLWQRQSSGTWRIVTSPGSTGNVDVAPANGNNVVIAAGTQVFASTNALASTVGPPSGVVFNNITRNLPARNVARAVFDPTDPTIIYAVLTGFSGGSAQNVFKTTVNGTSWSNISPPVNVPCGAIAVDGTTVPTTLYVGTDLGVIRSIDGGNSWTVLDDLHFPRAPVFDLAFNAQAGVLRAATYGRSVFTFTKPSGPAIAVGLQDQLAFGSICTGPAFLDIVVYNVGAADLVISSVQVLVGSSDFAVLPTPPVPVSIEPGEEMTFTTSFTPSSTNFEAAIIRISSNDPNAPVVDVLATGIKATGRLTTAIGNAGNFGQVCVGRFAEEPLLLNNSGQCPLRIFGVSSSSADFEAPSIAHPPIVIAPGALANVPIRFAPTTHGLRSGIITIVSDDPVSPASIAVSGTAPEPRLVLSLPNGGDFGACCRGAHVDEPLLIANSGDCKLTVAAINSSDASFVVPEVLHFPLTIEPASGLSVTLRFAPSAFGPSSATITVVSDDPASPATLAVKGNAPPGKLTVTGSAYFGGVKCGQRAYRTIAVCNVGECNLHVTKVAFERENRHWKLVHNPFPNTLRPGSCLDVVIRYKATQREPRPCELVITSDDLVTPVREVDVIAWTRCCCKECCEACREHRGCPEHHKECCEDHYRKCCDEEHYRPHEKEHYEGPREEEDREDHHDERYEERRHKQRDHGERREKERDDYED
jgi:photosystem II stability/assembly factor-like uncharacterized protein